MKKVIIPSLPNYSIDILGRVYRHSGNHDKIIENTLQGAKLVANLDGKSYDVFYLLVEAYELRITPNDRIKFKINRKSFTLALSSIKITSIKEREFYNSEDEREMEKYGCARKASNANVRFIEKITSIEIYSAIKNQDFHCYYCGSELKFDSWQVDHFYSKFNGGKNVFANIVASCNSCNRMKNTLDGKLFIKKCVSISKKLEHVLHVHNEKKVRKNNKGNPNKAGVLFTKEP